MKKLLTLVIAAVLSLACLGLTACGGKDGGVVDIRTKTITVAYTDYEPMNYTEDGVLKGFDTELALMVFNALGYEVRFKLIDWSQKYNELSSGSVDCLWNGFTSNSSDDGTPRSEIVNFTENYMENRQCIVKKSETANIVSLDDFSGKTVAFEDGSAGEDFISEVTGINQKGVASQMDAIKEVNAGTAQYAIVDLLLASRICGKEGFKALVINEGYEANVEYYAVGFAKNDEGAALRDKVNLMFKVFGSTGQLKELAEKYGLEQAYIPFSLEK